jgi:hypothetical protein
MKATELAIERRYADDSGVEYGVRYDARSGTVTFHHIHDVDFPVDEIGWLIDALYRVKSELPEKPKS